MPDEIKYVIIVGDGMADYPIEQLGNKTPLEVAKTPNMDWIVQKTAELLADKVKDGPLTDRDINLAFEIRLLYYLGYQPELNFCVGCGKSITGQAYF
jgi:2,3-bisphosphoglycerate-independent phosphoglycerate mutase